uniref:hypothetical protein n=1 Tax=Nocardioides stalactiti TaxID=2755356 RepID=UPI001C811DAD
MSGSGVLSEQQVLAIGRGLLGELARRHDAGQVGGVVAPATVLVEPDGSVRLVDGPIDPAYAAPEVLAGQ